MDLANNTQSIYFDTQLSELQKLLENSAYSKIFVLTDEHTSDKCLPIFQEMLDDFSGFDLIETSAGEDCKNIDFCIGIWKTLLDFQADRRSLLINLGGGVITDMGGFIASTYKRGIDFINIPTTLLAQVDASVGGKTGIDIDNFKNMVGCFALPQAVFIEPKFLETLPPRELLSGFAEVLKHGIIADKNYFESLKNIELSKITSAHIKKSVEIKGSIVDQDPLEKGLRKILNFGHTIGHAVETYFLAQEKSPLTHGEAIAIGMICESWLSQKYNSLPASEMEEITHTILRYFNKVTIPSSSFSQIIAYMQADKKNENNQILFTLLNSIGKCDFNCQVTETDIINSINYYNNIL